MIRRIGWTIGVILLLGAGAIGAAMRLQNSQAAAAGATASQNASGAPASAYGSEQEWIVAEITRTIAQVAAFAHGNGAIAHANDPIGVTVDGANLTPTASPASGPRFAITLGARGSDTPLQVVITDHLWAPGAYTGLARALLGSGSASATTSASAGAAAASTTDATADAMLAALTDLRVEVLLDQNRRVSDALTHDIRSAAAHEDAALLVGTLVLREAAGGFDDVRLELSRMTAHLAIARVLRGTQPPRITGTMAEIILLQAIGRQRDAVTRLDELTPTATGARQTWIRALRLRTTGDWRALPQPATATLLERLEYARALNTRLSSTRVLDFLDSFKPEPIADWARINLQHRFDVEMAHRFYPNALDAEIQEIARVWKGLHTSPGKPSSIDELLQLLNADDHSILEQPAGQPTAQPVTVQVLGWNTWAPFFQRHLCAQAVNTWRGNNNTGGRSDSGTLTNFMSKSFNGLRLFPIALRRMATTPAEYDQAMTAAREIARTHPEWITPRNWLYIRNRPDSRIEAKKQPFPDDTWYTPYVPAGTAYDAIDRSLQENCPRPTPFADIDRWAAQAPYDMWIVWSATWHHLHDLTEIDTMRAAFGPMTQYDLDAVRHIRDHMLPTPGQQLQLAHEACTLDVEQCYQVGWTLAQNGQDADAARAFESWIAQARDRVLVSNQLAWLVSYYYDTNQRARAEQIAHMVGDTHSDVGSVTEADLLDRLGQHEAARSIYLRVYDQYEDAPALAAFYYRQSKRTGQTTLADQATALVPKLFPHGLESFALDTQTNPPRDGVLVRYVTPRGASIGLRANDVFMAVDGVRVRNMAQYRLVWRLSDDAHVTLIVWRDGRYQQLPLVVPQRWFGAQFDTYRLS